MEITPIVIFRVHKPDDNEKYFDIKWHNDFISITKETSEHKGINIDQLYNAIETFWSG